MDSDKGISGSFKYTDLLGIPFKMGGRDKQGMDCYGLLKEIYSRRGICLPEYSSEGISPDDRGLIQRMITDGLELFERLERAEAGCLVTFFIRPPYTSHVGVVMPDRYRFIHILENTSVSVERLDAPEWERRITGYFRWIS